MEWKKVKKAFKFYFFYKANKLIESIITMFDFDSKGRKMSHMELYNIYTKSNKRCEVDDEFRKRSTEVFRNLENGDEKVTKLWKSIRETSIEELKAVYSRLG